MKLPDFVCLALVPLALACATADPSAATSHPHGDHMHKRFDNAEQWAGVFDDPQRDAWQKPDAVLDAMQLEPAMRVADIGAGTGYFTVRLARRLPDGVVYASDVEPDMVRYVGQRAAHEELPNVRAVQASANDAALPEAVDRVLVVDTYHHIGERRAYFGALHEKLRDGAEVVIVDFTTASPMGPPAEHRIPQSQVEAEMDAAGYALTRAPDVLPNQYVLVFARRSEVKSP